MPSRAKKDCEICNGSCKGEYTTGDVHPSDFPAKKWPHKFELITVGEAGADPHTGVVYPTARVNEGGDDE